MSLVWVDCISCRNMTGPYLQDEIDSLGITGAICPSCIDLASENHNGAVFENGAFLISNDCGV